MKELPLEKQFQIMDLLRKPIPVRDVARLLHVAKSTVQDYKKHGPPWFRRYSKTSSVESYPASIQEENQVLRQTFQKVVQIAEQAINKRNIATKTIQNLTQSKNQKEEEKDTKIKQQNEVIKKLEQDLAITHEECNKYQKQNIAYETQQQIHDKQLENISQKWQHAWPKIEHIFSDMSKEIETLRKENTEYKEKETRRQPQEPHQDTQIITESEPPVDEEIDDSSIEIPFEILFGIGIIAVKVLTTIITNRYTPAIPIIPTKTPQYRFRYGAGVGVPVFLRDTIQNTIHGIDTGITQDINTSGHPYYSEYNTAPNPQEGIFQPDSQVIDSSTIPGTSISGNLSVETYSGNAIFSNQLPGAFQPEIYDGVTPVTNSVTCSSGSFPIYVPTVQLTPPSNPSDSPIIQQYYQTSGRGFEVTMKEFFEPPYQNNEVELTPASRDGGVDLILRPRFGGSDITVVELKLWKEKKVGPDVIEKIFKAMKDHKANHALVITPGEFTKPALERAEELGVKCWDGKRLLDELYKHRFFKAPT